MIIEKHLELLADDISQLESKISRIKDKIKKLKTISNKYPDLKVKDLRLGFDYYSKLVNDKAKDYEFSHSCSCCYASYLDLKIFVVEEGDLAICTDPPLFPIAERYGDDYIEVDNWQDNLRRAGISEELIVRIQEEFAGKYPREYYSDEE